jgi:hypothetical protein
MSSYEVMHIESTDQEAVASEIAKYESGIRGRSATIKYKQGASWTPGLKGIIKNIYEVFNNIEGWIGLCGHMNLFLPETSKEYLNDFEKGRKAFFKIGGHLRKSSRLGWTILEEAPSVAS